MNSNAAQKIDVDLQSEQGVDQYLTFCLAGEEYGINILKVQEIRGWSEVTPMPNTPDSILGVINLRGTVVPIVELRSHFNLPDAPVGPPRSSSWSKQKRKTAISAPWAWWWTQFPKYTTSPQRTCSPPLRSEMPKISLPLPDSPPWMST